MSVYPTEQELANIRAAVESGQTWQLCDIWGTGGPTLIRKLMAYIDRQHEVLESCEKLSELRMAELFELKKQPEKIHESEEEQAQGRPRGLVDPEATEEVPD